MFQIGPLKSGPLAHGWEAQGPSPADRGINVFESPEECAVTGTDVLGLVAPSVVGGTGDCWMME